MPQPAIEIILMRQLASYLAVPIFIVDVEGSVLFYNEPAEAIVGGRFDETGQLTLKELSDRMAVTTDDGEPVPLQHLPLATALEKRRAAHQGFWIRGLDGVSRRIEVTAFPLEGQGGRHLGAVAIFWELPPV